MANIFNIVLKIFSQIAGDLEILQILAIFCGAGLLASLMQIDFGGGLFGGGVFGTSLFAPLFAG